MAISQYRGSPFAFQGSSRRGVVNMPGFSKRAWFDDVERNVRNLYDCENLEHDINVCRLGSELPAHYEVSVDGEVVDAPELVAGTGITITVADSNITINAVNNGDVTGPGTATGDNLTAFDGTTGKIIKDSGIAMADVAALLAAQVTVELASGTHELSAAQAPGRTRILLEDTDAGASIKSIHSDAPAVIHLWVQNTGPLVLVNNDGTPSEDHWPIITGIGANATVFGGSGPVTLIRDDTDELWRMQ